MSLKGMIAWWWSEMRTVLEVAWLSCCTYWILPTSVGGFDFFCGRDRRWKAWLFGG